MPIPDLTGLIGDETQTLNPATITGSGTTTDLSSVDKQGWGSTQHVLNVGESGDTWSGSHKTDVTLQDSPDDSTWTDVTDNTRVNGGTVAAGGIWATFDAEAEDNAQVSIEYIGPQQFSRLQLERTGNHSSGTPMSSTAFNFNPRYAGSVGNQPSF